MRADASLKFEWVARATRFWGATSEQGVLTHCARGPPAERFAGAALPDEELLAMVEAEALNAAQALHAEPAAELSIDDSPAALHVPGLD